MCSRPSVNHSTLTFRLSISSRNCCSISRLRILFPLCLQKRDSAIELIAPGFELGDRAREIGSGGQRVIPDLHEIDVGDGLPWIFCDLCDLGEGLSNRQGFTRLL